MAVKVIRFFDIVYFDACTITFPLPYMLGELSNAWLMDKIKKIAYLKRNWRSV